MGQLEDMAMFMRIIDAGGISKAAAQLNIAKSAVSRRLRDLEQRIGTQLLLRSTRTSKLTEAGVLYYRRAQNILDEVAELNQQAAGNKATIAGTLRMSAPLSFGLMHLSPLIDAYISQYDDLRLQVDFSDRPVDLIAEGLELAIRIGNLADSSYQARRITRIRRVVCASPAYLATHGVPETPADLRQHKLLYYGLDSDTSVQLTDSQGKQHRVSMTSKIAANNGDFLQQMALQNHGITCLPTFMAYRDLADGRLLPILKDYSLATLNAYAVYPRNRFLPERCRRFIDFLTAQFGDNPYWDAVEL